MRLRTVRAAGRWAAALLATALVAAVLSLAVLRVVEDSVAVDRAADLQHTTESAAKRLSALTIDGPLMGAATFLATTDADIKRLARGELADDDSGVLRQLGEFRTLFKAQNAFVTDKTGRIAAYSIDGAVSGTGKDISFRPYFRRAMDGLANVYAAVGTNTFERGLYFAVPILDTSAKDSAVIGVFAVKIALDDIDGLLAQRPTPAVLLSPQGVVFATNRADWLFRLNGAIDAERIAAIQKLKQFGPVFNDRQPATLPFSPGAAGGGFSAEGIDYGMATAPVAWNDPAGDWTLVLSEDRRQWLSSARRLGIVAGSGMLWGLLGLAAIFLWRGRTQRRIAADRLRRLSQAIEHSPVAVMITTAERVIHYVNPKFCATTGYTADEAVGQAAAALHAASADGTPPGLLADLDRAIADGRVSTGEWIHRRKDGTTFWAKCEVAPVRDSAGVITHSVALIEDVSERKRLEGQVAEHTVELEQALTQVAHEKEEVERALGRLNLAHAELNQVNRYISESIRYASRIQASLLPDNRSLDGFLHDIAVGWMPRDVVGGDFYWIGRFADRCLIAVVDCTGHGVPGAFMTAIVASVLDRILDEHCPDNPAAILQSLNRLIKQSLRQERDDSISDDGLDAAICLIDTAQRDLVFAGARIPLIFVQNGEIHEIKGDRFSLGYCSTRVDQEFTNHKIALQPGQWFYLGTDGVSDQVGGPSTIMFGRKRLAEILLAGADQGAQGQLDHMFQALGEYRGAEVQRDDMTFIAFAPLSPDC